MHIAKTIKLLAPLSIITLLAGCFAMGDPKIEALTLAAKENDSKKVGELIAAGVDVDKKDAGGFTALVKASYRGHTGVVKQLLKAGANPSLVARDYVPLLDAIGNGYDDVATLLVEAGANVNAVDPFTGVSALQEARAKNYQKLVSIMLEKGAKE